VTHLRVQSYTTTLRRAARKLKWFGELIRLYHSRDAR
jgi:hypothetical protein